MSTKKLFRRMEITLLFSLSTVNFTYADSNKPKFGPEKNPRAVPLYQSNDYFRNPEKKAAQFWALISYYIPQFKGASCSVASVAMTLNAARTRLKLSSDDKVISEAALLDKVKKEHWKERTTGITGYYGKRGMELDLLAGVTQEAFQSFGIPRIKTETVHVNDASPSTREKVIKALKDFEKNSDIYLIANFDQKEFTNDAQAGHIAPVGAYDSKNERVLILDPDRDYFVPYWVSVDTFIAGMNTFDTASQNKLHRGFVSILIEK